MQRIEIIDENPEHCIFFQKSSSEDRSKGINARLSPITATVGAGVTAFGIINDNQELLKIGVATVVVGAVGLYDRLQKSKNSKEEVVFESCRD